MIFLAVLLRKRSRLGLFFEKNNLFKFKHTTNTPYVLRTLYVVRISAKNQIAKTTK